MATDNAASKQQAENFHVLPKREAAKEAARTPVTDTHAHIATERDARAGSDTGGQTNQPERVMRDRSQVS